MTAKAHRPGQAENEAEQAADAENVAEPQAAATYAGPDLANVDPQATSATAAAETAAPAAEAAEVDETPLADLKALGNAKPDVNVTAVRNAHGFYTWTARDADGNELARSPRSHTEAQLHENLLTLFGPDSVVALRKTGDSKARRLS